MKTPRHFLPGFFSAVLVGLVLGGSAYGQAEVDFSGGSGAPLELTIDAPITYAITSTVSSGDDTVLVLQGAGDIMYGGSATGDITFKVNGGSPYSVNLEGSGYDDLGALALNDIYFYGESSGPSLAPGDVVVFSAGTLTTTDPVTAAAPASGTYSTFLVDFNSALRISADGVSVPEPATCWILLGGLGVLVGVRSGRRKIGF